MMNEKQLDEFKKEIYEPYNKAWKIIQNLKTADLSKEDTWEQYMKSCEKFVVDFPSDIGSSIQRVLFDAGDTARKISKMQ